MGSRGATWRPVGADGRLAGADQRSVVAVPVGRPDRCRRGCGVGRSSVICRPRGGRKQRSGPTGWICCGGSGSCGRSRCRGSGRLGSRPATFRGGCWWRASQFVRTGDDRPLFRRQGSARSPTRRRCVLTAKRCCGRSTTSIWMPAPAGGQPVSAGPGAARTPCPCASQSDGTAPQRAQGLVSAVGAVTDSSQHPRRGVQRDLRPVAVASRSSVGGVLRLHRGRASELLSATQGGVDPGRGLIAVTRKGSRTIQELPASSDAFVWLRLYQVEIQGRVPQGRHQPLWWTSRTPLRPLTYHAVHRMFERAGQAAGSTATLHALRHTAAYRMAEDPDCR